MSGVQGYKELCVAAKKEEKRLIELEKKQHYLKSDTEITYCTLQEIITN